VPTLYDLKPRFQALLAPAVRWMAGRGVTANQVTLAAAAGSVALGLLLALPVARDPRLFLLLPPFLLLRMGLNAIDGMLARQFGQASALGGLLNEVGDVVSDTALYLPFALLPGLRPALVIAAVILAMMTEFIGVCVAVIGASRRYDGPMGKSDRALFFGALGLWIGLQQPLGPLADPIMAAVDLLLLATCVNRARRALREL